MYVCVHLCKYSGNVPKLPNLGYASTQLSATSFCCVDVGRTTWYFENCFGHGGDCFETFRNYVLRSPCFGEKEWAYVNIIGGVMLVMINSDSPWSILWQDFVPRMLNQPWWVRAAKDMCGRAKKALKMGNGPSSDYGSNQHVDWKSMDGLKLTERFPEAQVVKCTWNRRSFDCQLWLATKQTGYVSLKPLFQARERGNPFEITSRHVCKKKVAPAGHWKDAPWARRCATRRDEHLSFLCFFESNVNLSHHGFRWWMVMMFFVSLQGSRPKRKRSCN
jgi:hypothetical protein